MPRGMCYSRQVKRGLLPSTNNRFNYFLSELSRNQRRQLFVSRQYPDLSSRQRQVLAMGSAIQRHIPVQNSQRRINMLQAVSTNNTETIEQEDDEQNEAYLSDVDVQDDEQNEADLSDVDVEDEQNEADSSDENVEDDEQNEADLTDVDVENDEQNEADSSDVDVVGYEQNEADLSVSSSSSDFTTESSSSSNTSVSSDEIQQEHPRIPEIHMIIRPRGIHLSPVAAPVTESSNSSWSQHRLCALIQNLRTSHIRGQRVEGHRRQEHPPLPVMHIRRRGIRPLSVSASQGLPRAQIQNLPTTNISGQQVEDGAKCNVCLTDYTERETVCELSCRHLYHSNCIATWLRTNRTCPTCRRNLS